MIECNNENSILNSSANLMKKTFKNDIKLKPLEINNLTSNNIQNKIGIDIGFKNLNYNVESGIFRKETKCILSDVNGCFKSGELSAIMGPSGAGKTSLLNIISGYINRNYSGKITVNENTRDFKAFVNQSAYITQDSDLQPYLTVAEAMHFSTNLKIGNSLTKNEKYDRIKNILEAISMYNTRHTRTGDLSGGQKKRLSVALELVDDPPVLILDEPTTGLDSSSSTQCISLLKKLSLEGKTVILTVHQPSALVFEMFDHLYAIAEGCCIYSGTTENLIPFLQELDLKCPEHYNPSDYLLEISTNDYGYQNNRLIDKIQNGNCENYRKKQQTKKQIEAFEKINQMMSRGLMTPVTAPTFSPFSDLFSFRKENSPKQKFQTIEEIALKDMQSTSSSIKKPKLSNFNFDSSLLCANRTRYKASFCRQLVLLLMRSFLILWRNKSLTAMKLIIHTMMGCFIGTLYYGIGNDAANAFNNFKYIFFSIMFVMYTAFSSTIVNFPLELPVISKESWNRWYSLKAYYIAITLADVPIQVLCTFIFISISYAMTNQPFELFRVTLFFIMVVMAGLVAQSIGMAVGSFLSVKNSAIFGPFFISPFLIFSGFFVQMRDVHKLMHWLFHVSFLKYALEGASLAIFGYSRSKLECNEIYCHFTRPKRFLEAIGMDKGSYEMAIFALTIIYFGLRFISFYIMALRLKMLR